MSTKITLLPGDGIGPEVTASAVRLVEAAGAEIEWESFVVGAESVKRGGAALPEEVLESIRRNKVCLKGPVTTPVGKGFRSINVELRQKLDLYANLRPARTTPGISSRFENVDLVIVRENTEGLYSGIEHQVIPGVVESLKIITEKASTRVSKFAFEYARKNGRKRVTAAHKANIMKLTDGLFLDCFRTVSKDYPDIEADDRIIDNMCMQLVMRPEDYDVLLMENLYGDIVSDLCAGLVGGLGVVGSANIGLEAAVFEAVHGSAPDIAGRGIANPMALIRSALLMLRHLEMREQADRLAKAMRAVVVDDKILTRDLGGTASTSELTEAVVAKMKAA